jgi:hypothetical protein
MYELSSVRLKYFVIDSRKTRIVWVARPKLCVLIYKLSMASSPFIYYHVACDWDFGSFHPNSSWGLGRATHTLLEFAFMGLKLSIVWVARPKLCSWFRSLDPNLQISVDCSAQTVLLVSVDRPKLAAEFGSSDPNCAAGFGRSTETSSRVWVVRPKPAAGSLGRSNETSCRVWVARPKPCSWFRSTDRNH